jgi:hypothetical protein
MKLTLKISFSRSHLNKFRNLSLNPTIRITVLAYDDDEKDFIPLYVSPHHNRQHQVNLLLLTDGDKHHYTLIRNMSRLVAGRTKHGKNNYVCEYCLPPCSSKNFYDQHLLECSAHSPQRVLYPEEGSTLEWTGTIKAEKMPFVIYADFETFLTPGSDGKL